MFACLWVCLTKFLFALAATERCHVQLWNRVRNGEIRVNVREQRDVSIATQERSNSSTQRFVHLDVPLENADQKSQAMKINMCWLLPLSQIYKSTKCNDMQQCGSCPRGPFCAFAHVESESLQ